MPAAHLGEGPAEEVAEVTPLPAPPSPRPLMVPAADITADIMAFMGDRSPAPPPGAVAPPPPRSPFCSFFSPLGSSSSSVDPLITVQ